MVLTRTRRGLAGFAGAFVLMLVAGCSTAPDSPAFPVPRFTDTPPIALDVAEIEIEQSYRPPMTKPNVEHRVPVSPASAARQWARDRFKAVGERGTATLEIVEAGITEKELETKSGVSGALTTEPATRYEARLEMMLNVDRPTDSGSLRVRGGRSTSVLEGASLNERDQAWYDLVKNLMTAMDQQMARTLSDNLGRYVVRR